VSTLTFDPLLVEPRTTTPVRRHDTVRAPATDCLPTRIPAADAPLVLLVHRAGTEATGIVRAVRADGLRLLRARTTVHAARLLESGPLPDLLILDGGDPELDLDQLSRRLEAVGGDTGLPILLLTPMQERVAKEMRALDGAIVDFVAWPGPIDALRERIRVLLRARAAWQEGACELRRLTQVGIALSSERNLDRLLERILDEARAVCGADAGTLYLLDPEARTLVGRIAHNETLNIRRGGTTDLPCDLLPVPLSPEYVSAYAALTGEVVNIPDVSAAGGFDFSGPRKYDALTGYCSRSMLVVPMLGHQREVIAVLQLLNARRPRGSEPVPFQGRGVEQVRALASQAGIALTNARLLHDLEAFLDGLLQVMAGAVDEKSRHTAGHIRRVTELAVRLGEAVNAAGASRGAGPRLTPDELEELRIAGLLHDIGKIAVPDHLVDKATKLEGVSDRIEVIRTRFALIRATLESAALRRKLELVGAGASQPALDGVDAELTAECLQLGQDLEFLETLNRGGEAVTEADAARLIQIAARTFPAPGVGEQPFLTPEETRALAIGRGTLLPEEIDVIRGHAAVTTRLLERIPFARKLRNVPLYAGDHHEMLDGSGYPRGKSAAELPLQSRILAIADIYDALTSVDRPYKPAYSPEKAQAILRQDAERGRLDAALVELFIAKVASPG
jgi:HD-GYP domain-containing protein (c-di-GMP phosphodiesterase class II)